ncbi:hypothetical protein PUNSTDRAFT_46422 [Punctularia strigosozonata HHB-11173 SS5]|uniref:uncharacterized protein n=1 Tax=Punctularia strigosozonata (strain HHB-11173) TaxID=741275 RepID=UPI000441786F|nr:uncharacterized protein PUNSTDRAFT_46422 [Punctularia strigosozonata HHB-11173 SS5]EIN06193.1 hypothetical protein PUNSTDRAFT_46422 [Punctularia strigosozonata HHB-11173 SS5]
MGEGGTYFERLRPVPNQPPTCMGREPPVYSLSASIQKQPGMSNPMDDLKQNNLEEFKNFQAKTIRICAEMSMLAIETTPTTYQCNVELLHSSVVSYFSSAHKLVCASDNRSMLELVGCSIIQTTKMAQDWLPEDWDVQINANKLLGPVSICDGDSCIPAQPWPHAPTSQPAGTGSMLMAEWQEEIQHLKDYISATTFVNSHLLAKSVGHDQLSPK